MGLTMRPYETEDDYWRIRAFLRQVMQLNGVREKSWHVARLDYWRWHIALNCQEQESIQDFVFLREMAGGQIAAVVHPEGEGDVHLQVHPEMRTPALEGELLAVAEERLAVERDGRRVLVVWTDAQDALRLEPGEGNAVHVVATKKASSQSRLDRIEVDMSEANNRVVIKTRKLFGTGNASVDLEITAPAGSRVSVDSGAGEVDVRGITGQIDIHSGAGSVDVRGAQGTTHVDLGAGQITYEGAPSGDCRFQTGVGEIILRLPESPNVRIDVGTGLGAVDVGFHVDGQVSLRSAEGVIGDGCQGTISAHTGVGSVNVWRQ
jgi:hypothetical protein